MKASQSKEVQGLLCKVAELETLVIMLIGILDSKGALTKEEVEAIFGMAELPEILIARIQRIETQGEALIEERKKLLSELLGIAQETLPEEEVPVLGEPVVEAEDLEEYEELLKSKDPKKDKLH